MYIGFFVDYHDTIYDGPRRSVGIVEVESCAKAVERISDYFEEENIYKVELVPLIRDYPIMSIDTNSSHGKNLEDVIHFLT